ncbi:MAG: alpha/beta fold hydrolase [Candidatus Lokiarchaeota archaeon]|nr:alpha/beta fold hydrolase [Candidatus Lokiarchaeota archaeon]
MVRKLKTKISIRSILLLIPLIFLAITASIFYFNRVQSYPFYERVQFKSAGSTLYANLYYPSKDLEFQDQNPLVIFAHGSEWQKDVDIRVALELTKRGFFVAGIDYHQHGESGGELFDVDSDTGVLGIAQDCSKLLDAIELLDVYPRINSSQIGLVGHSLGGMVVLMNGALDVRFTATISWAGVVNASFIGWDLDAYNPVNLINNTDPENLLLIHAYDDGTVSYEDHALLAQSLTGCTIINITDSFFSDHYLISDTVLIETIKWYELVFFGSESINGPINLNWVSFLIMILFMLIAMCLTVLSIIIYSSRYLLKGKREPLTETLEDKSKNKMIALKFVISLILYVALWVLVIESFGLSAIYLAPFIIIGAYILYKLVIALKVRKVEITKESIKDEIKSQFDRGTVVYSVFAGCVFMGFYYLIAFTIPWTLLYPPDFPSFIGAFLIFPMYLSSEIIYRKVLLPLTKFIKSQKKRTLFLSIMILFIHMYFVFISFWYYGSPEIMAAFFAYLMASVMNSILYHKTKKFISVIINSVIINGLFFGSTVPILIGLLEFLK